MVESLKLNFRNQAFLKQFGIYLCGKGRLDVTMKLWQALMKVGHSFSKAAIQVGFFLDTNFDEIVKDKIKEEKEYPSADLS
jgi:hypothetical protein